MAESGAKRSFSPVRLTAMLGWLLESGHYLHHVFSTAD